MTSVHHSNIGRFQNYDQFGQQVGCLFPIVIWSKLRMGQYRNDHREDAPHFNILVSNDFFQMLYVLKITRTKMIIEIIIMIKRILILKQFGWILPMVNTFIQSKWNSIFKEWRKITLKHCLKWCVRSDWPFKSYHLIGWALARFWL